MIKVLASIQLARQIGWSMYVSRTVGPLPDKTCAQPTDTYISGFQPTLMYVSVILKQFLQAQIQTPHMLPGKYSKLLHILQPRSGSERILFRMALATEPSSGIYGSGRPATMSADFEPPSGASLWLSVVTVMSGLSRASSQHTYIDWGRCCSA